MARLDEAEGETRELLARLRAFLFPGGEEQARRIRAIRTTERGEMRMSPGARPIPFTAEEQIDATRSGFRWDARATAGRLRSFAVTDAYEDGHGRLVVKLGGVIRLEEIEGPDVDKGELQRYLSTVTLCPPMLIGNPSLDFTAAGPLVLRVRDLADPTGASVDIELDAEGRPLASRADRPRAVGKKMILTPWSAIGREFREWEGLRIASRLEAIWDLPDGPFSYFQEEVTSFEALR